MNKQTFRKGVFRDDKRIQSDSNYLLVYSDSAYIEGQLVPAEDRSFSDQAFEETYLMTNISPQLLQFRTGIWYQLEEQIRSWTLHGRSLIIICGPTFDEILPESVEFGHAIIPTGYFKVVLDIDNSPPQAIGFIIPHQIQRKKPADMAATVDQVEQLTGLDFFYELFTDTLEEQIESRFSINHWTFDLLPDESGIQ